MSVETFQENHSSGTTQPRGARRIRARVTDFRAFVRTALDESSAKLKAISSSKDPERHKKYALILDARNELVRACRQRCLRKTAVERAQSLLAICQNNTA